MLANIGHLCSRKSNRNPPLSAEQKSRLFELEAIVEKNIVSFLEVGRALLAIRDERLYRAYGTWEQYCRRRFGITQCRGLELVRSAETAETLLRGPGNPDSGDARLPADLAPSMLRPLNGLEPALACACWRLATRIGKPTSHVVGQIVRVVKEAIDQGQSNSSRHSELKQPHKQIFLSSLYRLAAGDGFSAQIVTLHITESEVAKRCSTNCRVLISRCEAILRELQQRFPEI
jgi:hypothetical protein